MALDFLAGCVGGICGVIVGHPLDTVKVRIQTQSPDNLKYRGTFHCLSMIVKQESVGGLYKGISSPLAGVAAVNAMIFGIYGCLRPYVAGSPGNDALWAHFVAGSISGGVQSVVTSPMELVKTRMQVCESSAGSSAWKIFKGIHQNEGGIRRGLFKGWAVTLCREVPAFGTYFATYEALTSKCGRDFGTGWMMMAGGFAGVASWFVCFPFDVIKTRLQSDTAGKYTGAMDCVRKTLSSEGKSAFFRGLNSTLIRAFPTNAATFTVVTWIMRFYEKMQADKVEKKSKSSFDIWRDWEKVAVQSKTKLILPLYQFNCNLTSSSSASTSSNQSLFLGNTIFAFNNLVRTNSNSNSHTSSSSTILSIPASSSHSEYQNQLQNTLQNSFDEEEELSLPLELETSTLSVNNARIIGPHEHKMSIKSDKPRCDAPEIFLLSDVLDLPYLLLKSSLDGKNVNFSSIIKELVLESYSQSSKVLCKCLDIDSCVCLS